MEKHSRTIFISSTVLPTPLRLFMKQCKQCSSKNYHVCQESLSLVLLRDIIYFSCNSFLSCFHIPLLQLETLLFHLISLVALLCACIHNCESQIIFNMLLYLLFLFSAYFCRGKRICQWNITRVNSLILNAFCLFPVCC